MESTEVETSDPLGSVGRGMGKKGGPLALKKNKSEPGGWGCQKKKKKKKKNEKKGPFLTNEEDSKNIKSASDSKNGPLPIKLLLANVSAIIGTPHPHRLRSDKFLTAVSSHCN